MSLTIEQLERCYNLAMEKVLAASKRHGFNPASDENALVASALFNEIHRRKHGPFTLAEAIASGRPFRRKAWNDITVCERVDRACDHIDNLDGLCFAFVGGKYDLISLDDLTATDYELVEAGDK